MVAALNKDTRRLPQATAPTQGPYRSDLWAPGALSGIDPDRPVLILGTGLIMVHVTLALLRQGQRAPIHALSRRGLLPPRHAAHLWRGWESYREPMPPEAAEAIDKAKAAGKLTVTAGRVLGMDIRNYGVGVVFREYGGNSEQRLEVGAVIDYTGLKLTLPSAPP